MTSCSLRFLKINQGDRDISCFNAVTKWESNSNTGKNGSGEVLFIQGSECQSFHAFLSSQHTPLGVSPELRCIIQDANSSHTSTKCTKGQPPSPRFSTLAVISTHSPHLSSVIDAKGKGCRWRTAYCPGTTRLWKIYYVLFMVGVRESAITDKSS